MIVIIFLGYLWAIQYLLYRFGVPLLMAHVNNPSTLEALAIYADNPAIAALFIVVIGAICTALIELRGKNPFSKWR